MRRFWPRDQPSLSRPCSKAIERPRACASSASPISTPTVLTRAAGCAFAGIGQLVSAPPSQVMNSRRLIGLPQGQTSGGNIAKGEGRALRQKRPAQVGDSLGHSAMSARCPVCLKADTAGHALICRPYCGVGQLRLQARHHFTVSVSPVCCTYAAYASHASWVSARSNGCHGCDCLPIALGDRVRVMRLVDCDRDTRLTLAADIGSARPARQRPRPQVGATADYR